MVVFARVLQLAGMAITGYGAVRGFWIDFRERDMIILWGVGGLVFIIGTALLRRAS